MTSTHLILPMVTSKLLTLLHDEGKGGEKGGMRTLPQLRASQAWSAANGLDFCPPRVCFVGQDSGFRDRQSEDGQNTRQLHASYAYHQPTVRLSPTMTVVLPLLPTR